MARSKWLNLKKAMKTSNEEINEVLWENDLAGPILHVDGPNVNRGPCVSHAL